MTMYFNILGWGLKASNVFGALFLLSYNFIMLKTMKFIKYKLFFLICSIKTDFRPIETLRLLRFAQKACGKITQKIIYCEIYSKAKKIYNHKIILK